MELAIHLREETFDCNSEVTNCDMLTHLGKSFADSPVCNEFLVQKALWNKGRTMPMGTMKT